MDGHVSKVCIIQLLNDTGCWASECCIDLASPIQHSEATSAQSCLLSVPAYKLYVCNIATEVQCVVKVDK